MTCALLWPGVWFFDMGKTYRRQPVPERFWAKVDRPDEGCWEWLRSSDRRGYGMFLLEGRMVRAHRVSWLLTHGDPGEAHVLHRCDNPGCVRPDHLFLGTHQDNIEDMVEKRRAVERKTGNTARGSMLVRKDGRLELRAYAGKNPAGSDPYIREYFPAGTDPEAKEVGVALTALVARADEIAATRKRRRKEGGHVAAPIRTDRTAGDSLEAWWQAKGRHLRSASTARIYLDSYLLPTLDAVALWRLRPSLDQSETATDPDLFDLSVFFDGLRSVGNKSSRKAGNPLAPSTLVKARAYLSTALNYELTRPGTPLTSNPCAGVSLPRIEERESTTPEPAELAAFLPFLAGRTRRTPPVTYTRKRADGTPYTVHLPARDDTEAYERVGRGLTAFALLVASGPRPQEVAALRRGNLDRGVGRLSLTGEGVVDGELQRGETTKRRRRTIVLDRRTLAAVEAHLTAQDETALACGIRLGRRAFIFSNDPACENPVDPGTPSQAFERVVAAALTAGIPVPAGMRLYDMRHYGITQLLREGRDPARVAKRFGTSTTMLHARYEHAIPGDDDDLADTLADAWGDDTGDGQVIPLR